MRIKKIRLQNFKRFTDLTISEIPTTSKLVLVIGSNGSGKSSLFDAFDWLKKPRDDLKDYYAKNLNLKPDVIVDIHESDNSHYSIGRHNKEAQKFVGRSSLRIVPRIRNNYDTAQIATDGDRAMTYVDHDSKFINDTFSFINQINEALRQPVFRGEQANIVEIFQKFIEPLNNSLLNIFGNDKNTTIQIEEYKDATPQQAANLIFRKGSSNINYELLSHGEKQVFTLLINFIVRQEYYKDAIISIDEMDCHLNTTLQYALISEIVSRWIPENSQLWTASHALGFIDYARNNENCSIIDLDLLNFDNEQNLQPISKNNLDVYEIAIPKEILVSVLNGRKLVIVENQNDKLLNLAFGQENEFLFSGAHDSSEVYLRTLAGKEIVSLKDKIFGLRDKDYLLDEEAVMIKNKLSSLKILQFYAFENYLYHPDNIAELNLKDFDIITYKASIIEQKNHKRDSIISKIAVSRQHYIELKTEKKNNGDIQPIIEALKSDNFEVFYPFFDMKEFYKKDFLSNLQLKSSDLVKTNWLKTQIKKILNS